jgi:hypothetical protein
LLLVLLLECLDIRILLFLLFFPDCYGMMTKHIFRFQKKGGQVFEITSAESKSEFPRQKGKKKTWGKYFSFYCQSLDRTRDRRLADALRCRALRHLVYP